MNLEDLTFEVKNLTDTSIKFSSMREEVGIETYRLIAYLGGNKEVGHVTFEQMVELKDPKYQGDKFFFDTNGKPDLSILDLKQNANADFSKRVIANDEKITKIFKKRNLDLNKAKSSIIFDKDCLMGEKITVTSKDKCFILIDKKQ